MKTKKTVTRVISALLMLCMLAGMAVGMVACKDKNNGDENTGSFVSSDGADLPFAKEDNGGKEFKILYYTNTTYKNFFFDDVTEAGDVIKAALVERRLLVEDYLGIQLKGVAESNKENSIYDAIYRDTMSESDNYQVALTHSYIGLGNLATQGYIKDFYDFEHISLNDEYWNVDAMEALEIGGKAYFGTSNFMVNDLCAVFYNKKMYEEAKITENPYELVRNGEWTLEKLMELSSKVYVDKNGDQKYDKEDIYGFVSRADWEFIPLIDSCEVQCLTGSSRKVLNMGANNDRYQTLYDTVEDIEEAHWSYMYNFGDDKNKVTIADGRALFTFDQLRYAPNYLSSGVSFGVLPYPKLEKGQTTDYHSLDAGGMMCIPNTVQNEDLVGKVLECLSYYSADTVRIAYYERLLGSRVADAVDDAEMLKDYIFSKVSLNPAFNYCGKATEPLGILVYTIPKMLRGKLNGDSEIQTIATNWASNMVKAQEVIDNTINKKG